MTERIGMMLNENLTKYRLLSKRILFSDLYKLFNNCGISLNSDDIIKDIFSLLLFILLFLSKYFWIFNKVRVFIL